MHNHIARMSLLGAAVAAIALASACGEDEAGGTAGLEPAPHTIEVTSTAFSDGEPVPVLYTCQGEDVSPPLAWSGLPDGARSIALVLDDPDAPRGTFVHWVLYGIPPGVAELGEGVSTEGTTLFGATNGTNGFGRLGYGGPCPPAGNVHRYIFTVYALSAEVELEPGPNMKELDGAMEGKVIAEGRLMGTYQRR